MTPFQYLKWQELGHPALKEDPDYLWPIHKYNVGLLKDCEPVVIH